MNLTGTIELVYGGGPGSGCRGSNCGRKSEDGGMIAENGWLTPEGRFLPSKGVPHSQSAVDYGLGNDPTPMRAALRNGNVRISRQGQAVYLEGWRADGRTKDLMDEAISRLRGDIQDVMLEFSVGPTGYIPLRTSPYMTKEEALDYLNSAGTSEGAKKGWDARGRGRKQPEHGLTRMLRETYEKFGGKFGNWGLIYERGHPGNTEPLTKEEQDYLDSLGAKKCKIGECYKNAQQMATEDYFNGKNKLKYVEGLVTVHGVPISHSWLEINGKVADPTLQDKAESEEVRQAAKILKREKADREYYGVEIPVKEVLQNQLETKRYSPITENYERSKRVFGLK